MQPIQAEHDTGRLHDPDVRRNRYGRSAVLDRKVRMQVFARHLGDIALDAVRPNRLPGCKYRDQRGDL